MSNCCMDGSCPDCQEAEKKLAEKRNKAFAEQRARVNSQPIDATKAGTGIWRCQSCGQAYLLENDFKRFQCQNGCPGWMNKVDNFKRPALAVVKRIRGER